ncbi:MAG: hypothetical protein JSW59_12820 [Phycisphaerales bacterium]|nr:MAG: hypothetical protein JSW59_12820 [Phycisphaerales bacterium]
MLKRTLIAVAVVALLATSAQALGPEPSTGKMATNIGFKIHPIKMDIFWPFVEYKAIDLCQIPVKMEIGIFVQIEKCNELKIILKQVECGDIDMNTQGDWPCYKGCTGESDTRHVKVRSNFDITLGLKKARVGGVLDPDRWSAYFLSGNTVEAGAGWTTVDVCVKAWRARLYNQAVLGNAGEVFDVGTVTITVKPTV